MKRAVPAEFPAKFKKHNARPSQMWYVAMCYGDALDDHRAVCVACALGIEAIDGSDLSAALKAKCTGDIVTELARLAGFDWHYASGLDDGWQRSKFPYADNADSPAGYVEGFEDGRAAFEACRKAGLI